MIPQRIKLAGFLSYKDEQEIRLDGSPLWMLTGVNGSGKSSIFDAVTYALFGHHRGGSIQAAELVNKESNALAVEFDFTLDDHPFRIKRTLKKLASGNKSTFQILEFTAEGEWFPVPDTGQKRYFDDWIKDNIGLNYETFTSSVLLLQGKAEKLLDSTPSGRAGVLASIVDLDRYQKLHGKADDKRKELKTRTELLDNQIKAVKEVSDEEYALAGLRIDETEEARTKVQEGIEQLLALESQARQWFESRVRLAAAQGRLQNAESLLGHAVSIEKQHARLRELRDVMPTVGTIVMERGRVAESDRKTEQFAKELAEKSDRQRKLDHALTTARTKLTSLKKSLAEDEAKAATLNAKLRELAAVLEKVRLVEDQQTELTRFEEELKRLPLDPEVRVRELQENQEQLVLLSQALPSLIRIVDEKTELAQARHREEATRKEEGRLLAEGKQVKTDFDAVQKYLSTAKSNREQADAAAAEGRAHFQQAKTLADEFKQLTGLKSCRACGQPLTAEHFESEKKTRDAELRKAETQLQKLTAAADAAREQETDRIQEEAVARRQLEELRDQYKERAGEVKQAAADIRRLSDSIRDTYLGTPEPYKSRVSPVVPEDWSTLIFPGRDELAAYRREAAQIEDVRRELRESEAIAKQWQALRAKSESARDRLAKVKLALPAGDPVSLRQNFTANQSEETAVANAIKAGKKEIQSTEFDVEHHQRQLGETERDLVELQGFLQNEDNSRTQSHETIGRLCKGLPDAWQQAVESAGLSEQLKWKEEIEELEAKGIEAKHSQLQQARGGLDSLRAEIAGLEGDVEQFPQEARRVPDEVKAEVAAARKDLDVRDRDLLNAKQARAVLDGYRKQRAELAEQHKTAEGEHVRYKMLAELLGRDRLQRHLVRQAERQIVDYANAVLDRLSGGQLFLKLIDADAGTDKALDLECSNRVTGGSPINVAFLSGSQRFRVAVSLALGIGQYASKQHRPIESVIIDEGFGCLDRAGRQVMIQELQNLRGHLRCILLVSHQEEFADAFPDGYRFELQDGATKVSRFQR